MDAIIFHFDPMTFNRRVFNTMRFFTLSQALVFTLCTFLTGAHATHAGGYRFQCTSPAVQSLRGLLSPAQSGFVLLVPCSLLSHHKSIPSSP